MPAVTPQRGYPYQTITDAPAGHLLGENLALALDADIASRVAEIAAISARVTALENFRPLWSWRTTDSAPVNNSTTKVSTGLSVTLLANATYVVMSDVIYSSATGPDINFDWLSPASSVMPWNTWGLAIGVTTVEGDFKTETRATPATGVGVGGAGTGVKVSARPGGLIITAASGGPLTLQFAQNSPVGSNTVVHANSWLGAFRVA